MPLKYKFLSLAALLLAAYCMLLRYTHSDLHDGDKVELSFIPYKLCILPHYEGRFRSFSKDNFLEDEKKRINLLLEKEDFSNNSEMQISLIFIGKMDGYKIFRIHRWKNILLSPSGKINFPGNPVKISSGIYGKCIEFSYSSFIFLLR